MKTTEIIFKSFLIIIFFLTALQPVEFALAKKSKQSKSTNSSRQGNSTGTTDREATYATTDLLSNLQDSNSTAGSEHQKPKVQEPKFDNDGNQLTEEYDLDTIKYLEDKFRSMTANDIAKDRAFRIFSDSTKVIKNVFNDNALSSNTNIIKTVKQTACILVAETHYGKYGDPCDVQNVAQIRPPAYEEVYCYCKDNKDAPECKLNYIEKNLTIKRLLPYETPICKDVKANDELGDAINTSHSIVESPARDELSCNELKPLVRNTSNSKHSRKKKKQYNDYKWINPELRCINQDKVDYLANLEIPTWPEQCKNTNGNFYSINRVPAVPVHSIFTGILYLKLKGYNSVMSDEAFANFGANEYNAASQSERNKYKNKLRTCLHVLNTTAKTKIIEAAYSRTLLDKSNNDHSQQSGKATNVDSTAQR